MVFGPLDPSGADGLPADAVTCARLGCHGLAAVTALTVQDTAGIEEIHPVSPDLLDDQARCLLEDMSVQAIKVGGLYTAETASVAAQVAADYSQVPLVLHLGQRAQVPADAADEDDADDLLAAILELVLPQTDLLIVEHLRLAQWHADGDIDIGDAPSPMHALVAAGAEWVLVLGSPQRPGHHANVLLGPNGQTTTLPWQAPRTATATPAGWPPPPSPPCWRAAWRCPRPCARAWPTPTRRSPPASCRAWAGAFPTGSNRNESPAFSRRPVRRHP